MPINQKEEIERSKKKSEFIKASNGEWGRENKKQYICPSVIISSPSIRMGSSHPIGVQAEG